MKTCPFCAEDIQDAAIVCKHCGRDLVPSVATTPPAKKASHWLRNTLLAFGGLAVLSFVGQLVPDTPAKNCALQANGLVVSRDSPLGRATHWSTDVLAIRSEDSSDWKDVKVTMYGFQTIGTQRSPTGRYTATKDAVDAGALTGFELDKFQNATGEHWISAIMKPTDVEIAARVSGKTCTAQIGLKE